MMSSGVSSVPTVPPLKVGFDSHVELTIHDAFLQTAGLLQCDPIARVQLLTVSKSHAAGGCVPSHTFPPRSASSAPVISMSSREVGQTRQKLFTAYPVFDETISFYVRSNRSLTSLAGSPPAALAAASPTSSSSVLLSEAIARNYTGSSSVGGNSSNNNAKCDVAKNNNNEDDDNHKTRTASSSSSLLLLTDACDTVEDYVVIRIEDGDGGHFFGQAYCPFSPHCSSHAARESAVRVMLQPRHGHDMHDPLFRRDCAALAAQQLDSFGYVSISWTVQTLPHGGVLMGGDGAAEGAAAAEDDRGGGSESVTGRSIPPTLGLSIRALWLARDAEDYERCRGSGSVHTTTNNDHHHRLRDNDVRVRRNTTLELGGPERYPLTHWETALRLTIRGATELPRAVFHCTTHFPPDSLTASRRVAVPLPMPALNRAASYDRDIHWTCPVRSPQGEDDGLLLVRIRLTRPLHEAKDGNSSRDGTIDHHHHHHHNSDSDNNNNNNNNNNPGGTLFQSIPCTEPWPCPHINEPRHQEQFTHAAPSSQTEVLSSHPLAAVIAAAPRTPVTAHHVAQWESVAHLTEAQERRWRLGCVLAAQPTAEHVRHIFDVLMGRHSTSSRHGTMDSSPPCMLDPRVAELAAAMTGRAVHELTGADLKAVMVSCAFHARGVSAQDAARFCFMALRRDVETAVRVDEVHYVLTHCLLDKTVDMSSGERRRWVSELFGADTAVVSFEHFHRVFVMNYALWVQFGVPLTVEMRVSSGSRAHGVCHGPHGRWGGGSTVSAGATAAVVRGATSTPPLAAQTISSHATGHAAWPPSGLLPVSDALPSPPSHLRRGAPVFGYGETPLLPTNALVPIAPSSSACPVSAGGDDRARRGEVDSALSNSDTNHVHAESAQVAAHTAPSSPSPLWRSFVVRVVNSDRYFGVTAHVNDTVADAMSMTEKSVGIRASQQEWRVNGTTLLHPHTRLGQTSLGLCSAMKKEHGPAGAEEGSAIDTNTNAVVWVTERESSLRLQFHWPARQRRWQERIASTERILRVRAAVQRRTLIPLSRCVLRVPRGGDGGAAVFLQDRHTLAHYHLHSGDVIEVLQE